MILFGGFFNKKLIPMNQLIKRGWGGWDRTSASWSQSPLPYHLATPQAMLILLSSKACSSKRKGQSMSLWPFLM